MNNLVSERLTVAFVGVAPTSLHTARPTAPTRPPPKAPPTTRCLMTKALTGITFCSFLSYAFCVYVLPLRSRTNPIVNCQHGLALYKYLSSCALGSASTERSRAPRATHDAEGTVLARPNTVFMPHQHTNTLADTHQQAQNSLLWYTPPWGLTQYCKSLLHASTRPECRATQHTPRHSHPGAGRLATHCCFCPACPRVSPRPGGQGPDRPGLTARPSRRSTFPTPSAAPPGRLVILRQGAAPPCAGWPPRTQNMVYG